MNRDARDILGFGYGSSRQEQKARLEKALHAAVLLCEEKTVMPPGFFLECDIAYEVVSTRLPLISAGLIVMPRREINLENLIEKKRRQYGSVRDRFEGLFNDQRAQLLVDSEPYFIFRKTKIGLSATEKWEAGPDLETLWNNLKSQLSPAAIENLRGAPRLLLEEGQALTWAALVRHLSKENRANEELIRVFLQRNYFTLYIDEFELVTLSDVPHFSDIFFLPSPGVGYSYRFLLAALEELSILWLLELSPENLVKIKGEPALARFLDLHVQIGLANTSRYRYISLLREAAKKSGYKKRFAIYPIAEDAGPKFAEKDDTFEALDRLCDALKDIAENGLRSGSQTFVPVTAEEISMYGQSVYPKTSSLNVLVLNASPDDQSRIRVDREVARVEEQLEMVKKGKCAVSVVSKFAVRLEQIQKELLNNEPDVLHFSGHGEVGLVLFEDLDGNSDELSDDRLAEIVRVYGRLRCVVLHSCFSQGVAIACSAHVHYVIASTAAVDDVSAPAFSSAFYQALAHGRPFKNSFEMAVAEVRIRNPAAAAKYVFIEGSGVSSDN